MHIYQFYLRTSCECPFFLSALDNMQTLHVGLHLQYGTDANRTHVQVIMLMTWKWRNGNQAWKTVLLFPQLEMPTRQHKQSQAFWQSLPRTNLNKVHQQP